MSTSSQSDSASAPSTPPEPSPDAPSSHPPDMEASGVPPESGHARMPWFLLAFWVANILFFFWYLLRYAWPDLKVWINS